VAQLRGAAAPPILRALTQTTLLSLVSIGIGLALLAANGRLSRSMLDFWAENRRTSEIIRGIDEYNRRTRFGRLMTSDRGQRWFIRGWWLVVAVAFVRLGVGGLA
jgi:hypothetical protein